MKEHDELPPAMVANLRMATYKQLEEMALKWCRREGLSPAETAEQMAEWRRICDPAQCAPEPEPEPESDLYDSLGKLSPRFRRANPDVPTNPREDDR